MSAPAAAADRLKPYVPRLQIEWLRETPALSHREVEGSLAFVDISGFTRLTERLSRRGKVGAEEMSDTLDACFTALLDAAYEDGAGLVKWGGDAVLLLFDGPGHAARACRAAARMQKTMQTVGRLATSTGPVRLRMSVGIHSDAFHFFLVGGSHRELVVAGPAATATVDAETIAEAGEVALSSSAAALLPARHRGRAKGGAILLRGVPAQPEQEHAGPAPSVTGLDLEACVPAGIREHLLAGGLDAEHRSVSAAFVELLGTDELLGRAGPAALAEALDGCIRAAQDAAARSGATFFATDISRGGTKVILVAGAPTTAGDDEERVLRAARALVAADTPLPVRVGVAGGRVFAGDFGPPYRRTYNLIGDALNTAARLMGKASPGQVIATQALVERSRTPFATRPLEPLSVKGKAQPIPAAEVHEPRRFEERGEHAGPLVGRERELTALLTALRSAQRGRGRAVELVGEPGIGKSRLVEELRRRADALPVLVGPCREYDASTPYHPFERLLRDALGLRSPGRRAGAELEERVASTRPDLLPWLPLVAVPLRLDVRPTPEVERLDERFRRARLELVTLDLLGAVVDGPAVLVLDDAHWMDEASTDLARRLIEGVANRPWLVVVTRRDVPGGFAAAEIPGVTALRLEPLAGGDAQRLVLARTGDEPLPPHLVAALAERSGGNPLFLRELVAASRDAGDELPESIEALASAQIDRLSPDDRTVLRCASVLGAEFPAPLLSAVLGARRLDRASWSRLGGFLGRTEGGTVRFRHALLRDAAYEGLPYRRRRELHARAAETIERLARPRPEAQAEVLSLHFFHAQRFDRAWRYARVAGDRAQAAFAPVEAAAFYERALAASERIVHAPPEDVALVWEALGDARDRIGAFEGASGAYRVARRLRRGDAVAWAVLCLKEARIRDNVGTVAQALRWVRRGLTALEGIEGAAAGARRAELLTFCAALRQVQGRSAQAITWAERAIEEAERSGQRSALAHAYFILDWAHVELGAPQEAIRSPLALAIYEELGDLAGQSLVTNAMGAFAYYEGRWNEAVELYRRSREAADAMGDPVAAADATFNSAEILADQGRLEEADVMIRDALRVWRASGARVRLATGLRLMGRIASRLGRFDDAMPLLQEAREEFQAIGADSEVIETDARIAGSLVRQGRTGEGLALACDALGRAEARNTATFLALLHRIRGFAYVQAGELDAARQAFEESLAAARAQRAEYEEAMTLDALARLVALTGADVTPFAAPRDAAFARLGVVSVPEVPIGPTPAAAVASAP
jgi:class 3 adenylate cyclase/tetratricopeptide (TPR) repeat protein